MIRMDAAIARYWAITKTKGTDLKPMMPWPREEEPEATPEAALLLLKASMKRKK